MLNGACNLYADHVVFGTNMGEVNTKLQDCIDAVNDWYSKNKLTMTTSKYNVMLISSAPRPDHHLNLKIHVGGANSHRLNT